MLEALLIGAVIVGVLACPTMMWLGRRGIGPSCAMRGCKANELDESLASLKARQRRLDAQIEALERDDRTAAKSA